MKTKKAASAVKSGKSKEKEVKKESKPAAAAPEKAKKQYQVLRGMRDILPKEEKYWKLLYHKAENLADFFQFGRMETPLLEETNLFVRSIGKGTDVVDKEMYVFEDRDGSRVCLRPEATASAMRAYIGNGMWNMAQPVKVWYWGPMFRHDRPQSNRYREFFQVGYETIGVKDPAADAELILVAWNFFKDINLPVEVRLNSIGTPEERERYINELVSYYRSKKSYLCEDCKVRITKNPLRLLDCKEEGCQPVKEGIPHILDWLDEESKNYFMKVLEHLDELGIPYTLTPTLVRGLDYYTHTVFEFYPTFGEEGSQSALGGGGRYDGLAEELGGKPTPSAGMAIGLDRVVSAMRRYYDEHKITTGEVKYDVFFAQLGDEAKRLSLRIINEMRHSDIKVAFNFFKNSLKGQLEQANTLRVSYVIILGQKEVQDQSVIIRDMESGVQEIVDQKKLEPILRKKLGKPSSEISG